MSYTRLTGGSGPDGAYVDQDEWTPTIANEVRDNFDDHEARIISAEAELVVHDSRLDAVDAELANHESRIDALEAGGGAAGALRLLEVQTCSGQSVMDFLFTGTNSGYDHYEFRFSGILGTVVEADFKARFSADGGSGYDSNTIYDHAFMYISTTNSTAAVGSVNLAQMDIGGDAAIATTGGLSGHWSVYEPAASGIYTAAQGQVTYGHNTVGRININRSFLYRNTLPVQGVRFFYDSGVLTRGKIRLYAYLPN